MEHNSKKTLFSTPGATALVLKAVFCLSVKMWNWCIKGRYVCQSSHNFNLKCWNFCFSKIILSHKCNPAQQTSTPSPRLNVLLSQCRLTEGRHFRFWWFDQNFPSSYLFPSHSQLPVNLLAASKARTSAFFPWHDSLVKFNIYISMWRQIQTFFFSLSPLENINLSFRERHFSVVV